jgi:hypothetical protein
MQFDFTFHPLTSQKEGKSNMAMLNPDERNARFVLDPNDPQFNTLLEELVALFRSEVNKSNLEEVMVVSAPNMLGDKHDYFSIDATTRSSGGFRGIRVLDAFFDRNKRFMADLWSKHYAEANDGKTLDPANLIANDFGKAWSASMYLSAIELPNADKLNEEQTDTLNRVLSHLCMLEKSLVLKGPQSSALVQVFDGKVRTPLSWFIDSIAGNLVDIQQYVLSLLQAPVLAPIAGVEGKVEEACIPLTDKEAMNALGREHSRFFIYNNKLALGKTKDGVDMYLADAASDGTYNASGYCPSADVVFPEEIGADVKVNNENLRNVEVSDTLAGRWGQVRGFNKEMMFKGMRGTQVVGHVDSGEKTDCGLNVVNIVTPRMEGWSQREMDVKTELIDLDIPKGLGKSHPAYKWAEANLIPGKAVEVDAETYLWLIRVVKNGGTMSTSFQNTARWVDVEGMKDPRYVNSDIVTKIMEKTFYSADGKTRSIVDDLANRVEAKLGVKIDTGRKPYRLFNESSDRIVARMASSASTRPIKYAKERQNSRAFVKTLAVCDKALEYSKEDQQELELEWKLKYINDRLNIQNAASSIEKALKAYRYAEHQKGSPFSNDSWNMEVSRQHRELEAAWAKARVSVLNPTIRSVSQSRVPTTTDKNLTIANAMCKSDWMRLGEAVRCGKDNWLARNGDYLDVDATVSFFKNAHNKAVEVKKFGEGMLIHTLDQAKERVLEFVYSIEYTNIRGSFICNPAESRDRQADADGDDTACDPSLFWVKINAAVEAMANLKPVIVVELPKSAAKKPGDMKQDIPNKDGVVSEEVHTKGKQLKDCLPDLEWLTFDRVYALNTVMLASLQGATGLASNQEVDIYMRIHWEIVQIDGAEVCVPTKETEVYYDLWILYVLLIQLFIDNQKRLIALPYFDTKSWRKIPQAIRHAGGEGLKSMDEIGLEMATSDCVLLKKKFLAPNGTFNPALVYKFASEVMGVDSTCDYKASSKDGSIRKSPEEIFTALTTQPFNRSNRVWRTCIEACKPDGWRAKYGSGIAYMDTYSSKIAKAFEDSSQDLAFIKAMQWMARRVPVAMRELHLANLAKGEQAEDVSKMSSLKRGRIFMKAVGFESGELAKLAEGNPAKCAAYDNCLFTPEAVAIAMALGCSSRPVDAYEIFVSYIIADQELSQEMKEALAWGDERLKTIQKRVVATPEGKAISPTTGSVRLCGNTVDSRKMAADWKRLADDCTSVLHDYAQHWVRKAIEATAMTADGSYRLSEVISNAKLISNGVGKLKRASELLSSRKVLVYPHLSKKDLAVHENEVAGSVAVDGRRLGKNRELPGTNISWLKAVNDGDDMRYSCWKAIQYGRPVTQSGDLPKLLKLVEKVWETMPNVLIRSRTLFGGAGWHSADTGLGLMNMASKNTLWGAKAALGGTCSSLLVGEDTREMVATGEIDAMGDAIVELSLPKTKAEWHAHLVEGRPGRTLTIPEGIHNSFKGLFGMITPLPADFTIVVGKGTKWETSYEGEQAVGKLYSDALALRIASSYPLTKDLRKAKEDFFDARRRFLSHAETDGLCQYNPETDSYDSFDPMLDTKALRQLMAISMWKMEMNSEGQWVVAGEPDVFSFMALQQRKATIEARNESYRNIGL